VITLNVVMRANSVSCIGFGLVFLAIPIQVTNFLGTVSQVSDTVLFLLGIGLIINGLHLFWASRQLRPSKMLVNYFSIGDFIWLLASIFLVTMEIWIDTSAGVLVTMVVAVVVGGFGVVQKVLRREV